MVNSPGDVAFLDEQLASASASQEASSGGAAGRGTPFVLDGEAQFAPRYFPETYRRRKQRNLNRKDNFCGGENVSDQGQKNWEFHVVGRVLTHEVKFMDRIAESNDAILMTSLSWSGEVRLEEYELEGPIAWDPIAQTQQWQYTLDLVSTGRDEAGNDNASGIIDEGLGSGPIGGATSGTGL